MFRTRENARPSASGGGARRHLGAGPETTTSVLVKQLAARLAADEKEATCRRIRTANRIPR